MCKCPKCEKFINTATLENFQVEGWKGIGYTCPYCHSLLSIAIDPVALKTDTIDPILDELHKLANAVSANTALLRGIAQELQKRG
jgi:hypothetical protein